MKPLLVTFRIVEIYVMLNSRDQFLLISEFPQIVHLRFQDSPESFHRAIINTSSNSRHTLYHLGRLQPCSEYFTRILESSVTMEQRMCVGIILNGFIKGVEYQFVIITGSNFICYNPSVI